MSLFILCHYGCEQEAKYQNKSGNWMCNTSANKCPENKKKNSSGAQRSYATGKRLDAKTRYNNLPEETKIKMTWHKGLSKKNDERLLLKSIATSKTMTGKKKSPHTELSKRKMSLKRIQFLENNSKHCEWYEIAGIKVQGTLEKQLAEFLVANRISFERVRLRFQDHRTYTPDFYLPKFGLFIETKGFLYEKDKEKMRLVLLENEIDLRLAFLKNINDLQDENDLLKLPKVQSFIENIDYSKFENHWVVEGNWYTSLA
jgi:hypothetical protein